VENPEPKLTNPVSMVVADPLAFDFEHYQSRMHRYLKHNQDNQVFFDALNFAHDLHSGQQRKSGAPYISHPCAVAEILARELQFTDPVLLAAALLHDVVEDIPSVHLNHIEERFGETVTELVDGCTKLTRRHLDRSVLRDMTHSKIFLSASRRLGVLVIKLADRLHNLRTLHYLAQSKRQRIAQETVEVYAPIAARFNIFPLKRELYHLALSYLYPRKSKKILQFIREIRNSEPVLEIEKRLRRVFAEAVMDVLVRPRAKGLGSYYDHLNGRLDLANGENHIDFAIIMQSERILDCYTALGLVNSNYTPIPRSLRDFISNSKNNGYQSLHVRVHESGQNYLMKIRTPEMDRWATYGILREWDAQKPLSDEHWHEVSELLRSIGEYGGAGAQRKALIRLSESEEIFVYSPMGDIYYLPRESVVLDFAYRIHSELGDHCSGAQINGEWAPPVQLLKDGDVVEVLTSSELIDADPDLESLCKTPKARTAINKQVQHKRKAYAQKIGQQILEQELLRHGFHVEDLHGESMRLVLEFSNFKDLAELFARIGQDLLSPHMVLYYFEKPRSERESGHLQREIRPTASEQNIVRIADLEKAIHKFARCCNPYPGQKGVVTTLSERGITFHHRDCADLGHRHQLQPQQMVSVEWDEEEKWKTPLAFVLILADETPGALITLLTDLPAGVSIQSLNGYQDKHGQPIVRLVVHVSGFEDARRVFERLLPERIIIEDYRRSESIHEFPCLGCEKSTP
jgi:GTP diphosphokinase / guanosine-3',5'-bis(diphosphate) 3'-diphosphatase